MQHSWAKSCITLWSNAGRTVIHPCINWGHDCLTSVIKHKTFAPCYVSAFHLHNNFTIIITTELLSKKFSKYNTQKTLLAKMGGLYTAVSSIDS